MIGQLRGNLILKKANGLLIDVHGVGYEVLVPLSSFERLPKEGAALTLQIYTYVREDQLQLFGFLTAGEKDLFRLLISVSGIGPRGALAIISEISPQELTQAVLTGNVGRLTSISGIGKKTAERLVLEMKEKLKKLSSSMAVTDRDVASNRFIDLTSALVNLGYKQMEIDRALSELRTSVSESDNLEMLLKQSLKILRS